jgi:hypothetical protein
MPVACDDPRLLINFLILFPPAFPGTGPPAPGITMKRTRVGGIERLCLFSLDGSLAASTGVRTVSSAGQKHLSLVVSFV